MKRNRPAILVLYHTVDPPQRIMRKQRRCGLPLKSADFPRYHYTSHLRSPSTTCRNTWVAYVYVSLVLRGTLRGIFERAVFTTKREVTSVRLLGSACSDKGTDSVATVHELHVSLTRPALSAVHQKEEMKRAVRDAAKAHAVIPSHMHQHSFLSESFSSKDLIQKPATLTDELMYVSQIHGVVCCIFGSAE